MSRWKRMVAGGALIAATALTPVASAFAADKPADDAGARVIADFLSAYLGKAALPDDQDHAFGIELCRLGRSGGGDANAQGGRDRL